MNFLNKYSEDFKEYDAMERDFIDDDKIWAINKMIISKAENLQIIEKAVDEVLKKKVAVKCIGEEDLRDFDSKPEESEQIEDRLVQEATNMAKELNVPVKIYDE
jgi:hypothetical protein